ncbi:MAG: TonB family protein [Candidatus Acidiferrales bacterium]
MPDMAEYPGGFRQTPDRRLHARRAPVSLTYVEMGENNGGIMLNLSESGLAVTTAEVLGEHDLPRMRFQLPQSEGWIETSGQLVWVSASRKEAGIRFTGLSEEARLRIREWVGSNGSARTASRAPTAPEKRKQFLEMPSPRKGRNAFTERATSGRMVDEELEALFPSESTVAEQREERARTIVREEPPSVTTPPAREVQAAVVTAPPVVAEARRAIATPEERPAVAPTPPPIVKPPDAPVHRPAGDSILKLGWQMPSSPIEPYGERRSPVQTVLLVFVVAAIAFAAGLGVGRGAFAKWLAEINYPAASNSEAAKTAETPPANASDGTTNSAANNPAQSPSPPATTQQNSAATGANPASASPDAATANNAPNTALAGSPTAGAPAASSDKPLASIANSAPASAPLQTDGGSQDASASDQAPVPILVDAPAAGSAPLMLDLPEAAVSASGYVAITDRRIVYVPPSTQAGGYSSKVRVVVGSLMFHAEPLYPPEARQRRVEGTVELHATVDENGEVTRVQALNGPTLLIPSAVNAVREWQYKPTLLNGQPVPTQEDITIAFRLP